MSKNRYNSNNNEFEQVKKLLKELPKEKAADNFEYNLMVRIKNGNFEQPGNKTENFTLWKIFVPAAGMISAVFLFFVFFNDVSEDNSENIFQTIPQLRTEISSNLNVPLSATKKIFGKHKITDQDVVLIEPKEVNESPEIIVKKKTSNKPSKYQGMAALPFEINNSTDLDAVVQNNKNRTSVDRRATLAGMSSSRFNGFFLGQELNRKEVEAMKARIDSIKKMFYLKRK